MEIRFPLILDGATGTELQKHGYAGDVSAEQWTLAHPDILREIQRGYVAAGSQVLYTPTFGANRQKLEERGIFNRTADFNRRLAALSREAADGRAWIAGDLAPTGLFLAPLGEASFEDLVDIYTEQAAGLEEAGVDLFVIETMMTLSDARAAVLASLGNSYVILNGLREGEEIVTNGVFAIDASAQLEGKTSMMNNGDEPAKPMIGHEGHMMHAQSATGVASEHAMFGVKGSCDMCKERIEKAAKGVNGVLSAHWDKDTQMIHLQYDPQKTSPKAISKAIAKVGHDTDMDKADKAVYDKLPACCHYR